MATHFSILAWKILWTEEPGGLLHRVAKSQTRLGDQVQHSTSTMEFGASLGAQQ